MADIRTKKLINDPEHIITEAIAGMVSAHPTLLRVDGVTGRAVVAIVGPRDGKVGLVTGGGSGHEPLFCGYVGPGLLDAAAVGNVFASPSPDQILDAARAVDGGAGVMFLYGNYTGDVMNFDMAAEVCEAQGIAVRSVAVHDDVASAPPERVSERRGVAGNFFVFKVVGAAAAEGRDLAGCEAVASKAQNHVRTMGVALTACSLPQTGKLNFEIGHDEMEIGMGIHGEPGMTRQKLASADEVTDKLVNSIMEEMSLNAGDRVAVLVNGLGATGLLELYIVHRRVADRLAELDISIHRSWVGEYATSLEMAGASVSFMKLDNELQQLLDAPCRTTAFTVAGELPSRGSLTRRWDSHRTETNKVDYSQLASDGEVTPAIFTQAMLAVADAISEHRDWLSELDGVIGDGDHGVTMDIGWSAVRNALKDTKDKTITHISDTIAKTFLDAVGASTGPLYSSAFSQAGKNVSDRLNLDTAAVVAWLEGILEGIVERGGAEPGDKTMVDAWLPAVNEARRAFENGEGLITCLEAACIGARGGRDRTAKFQSRRGRSKKLAERSIGHVDPGAASAHVMIEAMRSALIKSMKLSVVE